MGVFSVEHFLDIDLDHIPEEKECTACRNIKTLDEFYNNKNNKYGKCYICKNCYKLRRDNKKEYENLRLVQNYYDLILERKKCVNCGEYKDFSNFHSDKNAKFGLKCSCKKCINLKDRLKTQHKNLLNLNIEYIDNELIIEGYNGKFCNKCDNLKKNKQFYKGCSNCVECDKKYFDEWYENNQKHIKEYRKKYYQENKEEIRQQSKEYRQRLDVKKRRKEYRKKWYEENKEYAIKQTKKWRKNNKEKRNKKRREKYNNDPSFKLIVSHRNQVNRYLNGERNSSGELLGCSPEELKQHLESQFKDGMTWENWGCNGWHVDHIIPCSFWNLEDEKQQAVCFHYTNMRPMWGSENISKGDTVPNLFEGLELDKEFLNKVMNYVY